MRVGRKREVARLREAAVSEVVLAETDQKFKNGKQAERTRPQWIYGRKTGLPTQWEPFSTGWWNWWTERIFNAKIMDFNCASEKPNKFCVFTDVKKKNEKWGNLTRKKWFTKLSRQIILITLNPSGEDYCFRLAAHKGRKNATIWYKVVCIVFSCSVFLLCGNVTMRIDLTSRGNCKG